MTGPSGVDAPAADNPSMIGDPFRAFSAASQGDWDRAATLMVAMSETDWRSLVKVIHGMCDEIGPVTVDRMLARRAPTDPAASNAAAAPSPTQHGHE